MSHPDPVDGPPAERRDDGAPPNRSPQERKVDEERREIERGVYERRTADNRDATDEGVEASNRIRPARAGQKAIEDQRDPTATPSAEKHRDKH